MENNSEYMIRVTTQGKMRPLPPGILEEEVLDNLKFFQMGLELVPGGILVNSLDLSTYLAHRDQQIQK